MTLKTLTETEACTWEAAFSLHFGMSASYPGDHGWYVATMAASYIHHIWSGNAKI